MHYLVEVKGVQKDADGATVLTLSVPDQAVKTIRQQAVKKVELRIDDGRIISGQQRRKIYATLRDIAEYTGYTDEAMKEIMKYEYMLHTGNAYFSLSSCSVETARLFINVLMEYALKEGVILTESGLQRTDDIDTYLIQCIRYRKCCVCGRVAEIHHVDAIGMGNDRRYYDDGQNRIMALCRQHHMLYHQRGGTEFCNAYKVYGIEKYRVKEYMKEDLEKNE